MRTFTRGLTVLFFIFCAAGFVMAVDYYGEFHGGGGVVDNAELLPTSDPNFASATADLRMDAILRLLIGMLVDSEQTRFDMAYAPQGEIYKDVSETLVSHMFTADLIHRFTPRTTIKVAEFFSATPENLLNPIAVQRVALPVGSTGTIGNNFETRLEVRKSELTAFEFKVADSRRIYDAREFVDSVHDSVGVELRNRLSPHNTLRTGYEYGIFSFQDGHAPTLAPVPPPPPPPPAPLPGPTPTAAGALSVTGLGSARHRPYVGYLFDRGRGLHLDLRVGQDMLSFDDSSLQKTSSPFVDSAVGWIWSRARFIVGYGMGIEEGGGVFTNARSRRGRADIGFRITDALSLLLTGGHEIRDSLEEATPTTTGTLKTTLAGSSLVYVLSRKWAFDLTFTRYSQTSEGLADRIPDITTNRFLLGATYAFGRRNVKTPFAREDEVIEEEEPEVPVPETPETP